MTDICNPDRHIYVVTFPYDIEGDLQAQKEFLKAIECDDVFGLRWIRQDDTFDLHIPPPVRDTTPSYVLTHETNWEGCQFIQPGCRTGLFSFVLVDILTSTCAPPRITYMAYDGVSLYRDMSGRLYMTARRKNPRHQIYDGITKNPMTLSKDIDGNTLDMFAALLAFPTNSVRAEVRRDLTN